MSRQQQGLVLGIGNLLLQDEGVGVHVIRRLQEMELPAHVELLDGGTGGFHLLGCFDDYATLVLVDAALNGLAPGTVTVTEPRYSSDFPRVLSSHDIGLRDLIESAELLGKLPRMFLVAISIDPHQSMGTELSGPVRDSIDSAAAAVQAIWQRLHRELQPLAAALPDRDEVRDA
jgi:hydrogenase maturation protease